VSCGTCSCWEMRGTIRLSHSRCLLLVPEVEGGTEIGSDKGEVMAMKKYDERLMND
jgi:hypothetical protein